jgi:hypothetical protein
VRDPNYDELYRVRGDAVCFVASVCSLRSYYPKTGVLCTAILEWMSCGKCMAWLQATWRRFQGTDKRDHRSPSAGDNSVPLRFPKGI